MNSQANGAADVATGSDDQSGRGNRPTPPVVRAAPSGKGNPVVVTVLSDDLLSADGVITHLKSIPAVRYVPLDELDAVDVVLVVAVDVSEQRLAKMEPVGKAAAPSGRRRFIVLIADSISERHLGRIFASGVVGILPRRTASRDAIAHAVTTSRAGGTMLPEQTIRWLVA